MKEIRGAHPYRSLEEDDEVMSFEEEVRKRKKMWKRPKIIAILLSAVLAFVIVIVTLIVASLMNPSHFKSKDDILPVTHTTCGKVVGINKDGTFIFYGIPYAKPPIGIHGRWRPPEQMTPEDGCWNEELLARKPMPQCLQDNPRTSTKDHTEFLGSEDCLYLNVWTPTLKTEALKPVIVYIHGGFLRWGSGLEPTFIPTPELVDLYDAVFVTINYRLYALGFLALEELSKTSEHAKSGNYGLLDQIMALRWVRDNIRNFGGNPEKVILLGQGSGATSIVGLLTSPPARNLFQGAWLSSPSPFINTSMQDAWLNNQKLVSSLNCTTLKCLHELKGEEVQRMALKYWDCHDCYNFPVLGSFDPDLLVVDGEIIPFPTLGSISHEVINDVPLVIGSMAQEVDSFPPTGIKYWEMDSFNNFVSQHLDTFGPNLTLASIQIYNESQIIGSSPADMELAVTTMISDVREVCPTNHLASAIQNAFTSPIFRYVVTRKPSHEILTGEGCKFACSQWDIVAIFGSTRAYIANPTPEDLHFEKNMQNSLKEFIHHDTLKHEGWNEVPKFAIIDSDIHFQEGYHEQACKFWMDNGFLLYAWKN